MEKNRFDSLEDQLRWEKNYWADWVAAYRVELAEIMIGGNHLGLLIGTDHPSHTATCEDALTHYGAGDKYEIWCCWKSIMVARDNLRAFYRGEP